MNRDETVAVNLSGADLSGADLRRANLSGVTLTGDIPTRVYLAGFTFPEGEENELELH